MIPTYGSENPCSTLLGTAQFPFRVDPLSVWLAAAAVVVSDPKSFFKFAENQAAISLGCG